MPIQNNQKICLNVVLQECATRGTACESNSSSTHPEMQLCFRQIQHLKYLHVRRYVKKTFLNSYSGISGGQQQSASSSPRVIVQDRLFQRTSTSSLSLSNPPDHSPNFLVQSHQADYSQQSTLQAFTEHLKESESIALVPIVGTKHQLIFFEQDSQLRCVLLPKFHLILDIDDTLITTRVPATKDELPKENEQDLYVPVRIMAKDNTTVYGKVRFLISKREGVSDMLRWASQIFNVSFITNGAYIYARAVLHYLDPDQQHILKYVGHNEMALREILKSREDLLPHSLSQKMGLKKLQLFGLPLQRSVILDDDKYVWHESNQSNLLPFDRIVEAENKVDYLNRVAEFIWKHLEYLSNTTPEQKAAEGSVASSDESPAGVPIDSLASPKNLVMEAELNEARKHAVLVDPSLVSTGVDEPDEVGVGPTLETSAAS